MEEEDWEVVSATSEASTGADWEEVNRSRSATPSSSRVATLETELRDAQERITQAEARADNAENEASSLRHRLHASENQVQVLQVVVAQQRMENEALIDAVINGRNAVQVIPRGKAASKRSKDKKVSRAKQHVAPQDIALPKRKAWGKANHRTSTTGARHI